MYVSYKKNIVLKHYLFQCCTCLLCKASGSYHNRENSLYYNHCAILDDSVSYPKEGVAYPPSQ
jgi:hypothetical protein